MDDALLDRVLSALENPKFKWRTVPGVVKEVSAPEADVMRILQSHPNIIIKSTIPGVNGEDLYTTRKHFKAKSSYLTRLVGALANRVN